MKKSEKIGVKRFYKQWSWLLREKGNKKKYVVAYFMGAWTTMNDAQAAWFLGKLTKKERKEIMTYPIWQ